MTPVALPQPGGCYCGAVRFELTALPFFSYLCHCSICRRRSGAAYGISTPVPVGAVRFTAGEPGYEPRVGSSGQTGVTAHCPKCLSRFYSAWEGATWWTFRPGLLDDSSWLTPVGQMWTANALPWALLDSVPSFEGNPPSVQPFIDAWATLDLRPVERTP